MDQHYRKTFDQITMPEDKAQAIRSRLAARCSGQTTNEEGIPMRKTKPFRRPQIIAVAVVAVLLLSLGTAGATGALKSVGEVFAGMFGASPTQTKILNEMGHPVGVSATADGLTISVDAIIGDAACYAIVYSITPEDGVSLPLPRLEEIEEEEREDPFLTHEVYTYSFYKDGMPDGTGIYEFYDADPSDPSIQFVEKASYPEGVSKGTVKRTFENLSYGNASSEDMDLVAAGPWKLTFSLDYEDNSITLATNQTISVKGETATVDTILISPLSVTIESSFDKVIDWEKDLDSDPFASYEDAPLGRAIMALPVSLTMKDGSVLDLSGNESSSIGDRGGKTCYTRNCCFPEILPLDTIESVTIGELTIPVEQ